MNPPTNLPARIASLGAATSASNDEQLVASWLDSLGSDHSKRNFATTASAFLGALGTPLRSATVEDARAALATITAGKSDGTARQYVLRIKSLIAYAHRLGYVPFNAGVAIKVKAHRSTLAKRIMSETDVALLIRAARTQRDRTLLQVAYAAGLRVSELVSLTWADVILRDNGRIQLSITGKGGRVRQVLLPEVASRTLLAMRGEASAEVPLFPSPNGGCLTERAVNGMIKRTAKRAGINPAVSAHWLRHGHASHALDRGATLAEVQATLGHANVATTSAYLHARPERSSGLTLDPGVFLR